MKILQTMPIILMLAVMTACNSEPTAKIIDDLDIGLAIEPDPPTTGEAMLMISVKDADNNPIDNATVAVHGDMDHEGMIPVDGDGSSGQDGMYHVPFEWSMGGGWIIDVTVTLPDNEGVATERFELNVGAISEDSIINQSGIGTTEMDHSAMNDMGSAIQIHYAPDNDPAFAGNASVVVILTSNGEPINDATIILDATMPAHDMMPIREAGEDSTNGRYTIPVRWTMAGEWQVDLTITLSNAEEITQTYIQQVIMSGDSDDGMSNHENSE